MVVYLQDHFKRVNLTMRLLRSFCAGLLTLVALESEAGLHFQQVAGPNGADTNALAADGPMLWAGTLRGVWKLSAGAWTFDGLSDKTITSLAVAQGSVWAAAGDGLWRRDADGTWNAEPLPNGPSVITTVFSDGTTFWACGLGVYRRLSGTWTALAAPGGIVAAATVFNGDLVVGRQNNGAARYTGSTVVPMIAGMGVNESANAFAVIDGTLWAGTARGLYSWNGASWVSQSALGLHDVRAITDASGTLRVATLDAGALRQTGAAWVADNEGILFPSAKSFATLGTDLYLGIAGSPVYRLGTSTWIEAGTGLNAAIISDLFSIGWLGSHTVYPYSGSRGAGLAGFGNYVGGNYAPTGCGDVIAAAPTSGSLPSAVASTNCGPFSGPLVPGGLIAAGQGLPAGTTLTTLDGSSGEPWAGTSNAGVFRLLGSIWIPDQTGLPANASVQSLRWIGGSLFAAAGTQVFVRQTSGWVNVSSGLNPTATVQTFGGTGSSPTFAGLVAGGVLRRDGTSPWRADFPGLNGASVFSLDTVRPTYNYLISSTLQPDRLFAAAGPNGVQRKHAGGWLSESSGLPPGVDARVVRGLLTGYEPRSVDHLFVGTAGHGIFSAPVLTSMKVLPVVLDVVGVTGARFRTEFTIGNRFADPLDVGITFTPAPGFGGPGTPLGTIRRTIPVGAEMRISNAIDFLRSAGLPIPPSDLGPIAGTLSLTATPQWVNPFPDPHNDSLYAMARTYTSDANGTYGMAYDAPSDLDAAEEEASVYGLRSVSGVARSNLAVAHLAGRTTDPITLSAQVYSADGTPAGTPLTKSLAPSEWYQWNGILGLAGLPDGSFGYVRIKRVSGIGPWTAYGVVNDAITSDASFLPPYRPGGLAAARRLVVPVVLDVYGLAGSHYTTELTLANDSTFSTPVDLVYQPAPGFGSAPGVPFVTLTLAAGAQSTIPDVIEYLRANGVNIPDPAIAGPQAGTLMVTFRNLTNLDAPRTVALARTSTPNPDTTRGGSYGLFYPAAAKGGGARTSAVVPALTQDASTRSNLALVHLGGGSESALTLSVQLYDAATGTAAGSPLSITLQPGDWFQWSRILELTGATTVTTKAVAVVTRVSGDDTWLAYGVLNDAVNSDGSYVRMIPAEEY
jgi:hypothetical protein